MSSSDETLRTFAEKHCGTMKEFRDLTHVVVIPILARQALIDDCRERQPCPAAGGASPRTPVRQAQCAALLAN
jgi:hypothetical protein